MFRLLHFLLLDLLDATFFASEETELMLFYMQLVYSQSSFRSLLLENITNVTSHVFVVCLSVGLAGFQTCVRLLQVTIGTARRFEIQA